MKGLLIKDFYNLRQILVWYVICVIGFTVVSLTSGNSSFITGIGVFLTVSVPTTSMAYDERDKWLKYARACGIKTRRLVQEKYLLTLIVAISIFALLSLFNILSHGGDWLTVIVFVSLSLLTASLLLPFLFKYGTEKGRVILIVAMIAVMTLSIGIITLLEGKISADIFQLLYILLPVFSAGALLFSSYVSIKIMDKKDL